MNTLRNIILIVFAALLHIAYAQDDRNGQLTYNLSFILIPCAVFLILVVCAIFGADMIYRARYGAFACCEPSMRYRRNDINKEVKMEGGLPKYTPQPHPTGAPPAYQDALKDELTDSTQKVRSESIVSDELDTTDQTPLNP